MRFKKAYKHGKSRFNVRNWLRIYQEKRMVRKNKKIEDEIRSSQIPES
jgi:hypothetical protein